MSIDFMRMPPRLIFRCSSILKLAHMNRAAEAFEKRKQERNAWRKFVKQPRRKKGPILFFGHNTGTR